MMLSQSITSTLSVWENAFIKKRQLFFVYSTLCVLRGRFRENCEIKMFEIKAVGPVLLPDPQHSMSPFYL